MIQLENVNYIYNKNMPDERQALFDVSLTIPDGRFAALIGHTGSGKSTLVQLFNALEKAESGKIIVNGIDVMQKKPDLKRLRREVGLVFQYPEHQLFEETVYKDIAFGPKNMGLSEDEIDRRVKRAMAEVGLSEKYENHSPFEMSGGQKRRCAIAGVIAMEPKILVLDEPAAGLDPKGRDEILDLLKNLHKSRSDMTIIFVSHSMEDVARVAEYIYVMNHGRLAMEGSVGEVFAHSDELCKMGLDVPQITTLFDRLKKNGFKVPENVYTVKYAVEETEKILKGGHENA